MMSLNYVFEYSFILGLVSFSILSYHFLSLLISLEFIMLSNYFFVCTFFLVMGYSMDFILLYLSMMIMEGIFGLSILVFLSRYGSSIMSILIL